MSVAPSTSTATIVTRFDAPPMSAKHEIGGVPLRPQDTHGLVKPKEAGGSTYGQILKSSALIGGSSLLTLAIGIIRTKAMAILLGPAGIGLLGLYGSISDLARSIAGMGVNSSGVRQIAEAVGSGNSDRIARTVTVLRRMSILLGVIGAALLAIFSTQISVLTFGSDQHANAIALLSVVVLFRLIADGQGALIQGTRRIADLAKMGVLGAFYGTLISVPVIYAFGEKGVVPSLIAVAAMGILMSWWYARKVQVQPVKLTRSEITQEAASLLKLGLAFMVSGFLVMGAAYAVSAIIVRQVGLEAAGLYQAAWTLGGLYVSFILQAMGADFYPRLVGVANDTRQSNRLVNEQAHVSLLLAGPGVIATLAFAPLVVSLFYTSKFADAVDILRWICLGMTLRVVTWPMGYILVAKGKQAIFVATDVAWTIVNVGLSYLCVKQFGANGAGIAFFGSYVFHALMIYPIVRQLNAFRWSAENIKTALVFLPLIAIVFTSSFLLTAAVAVCIGILATLISTAFTIRALLRLASPGLIPRPILRLLELRWFNR